jgi:hypothetical protein
VPGDALTATRAGDGLLNNYETPAMKKEPAVGLRLPTTGSRAEETVAAAPTPLREAQGRSRGEMLASPDWVM